ncbi:MAG: response regulator receiver protein [Candidatus Eremiobacteraeota bacterium]|nr:response regulator receiver protein [Candidatus Eremiobacteraeota bacterium]
MPLIAIVDDDEDVRSAVHAVLKSDGFSALAFASSQEFLHCGKRSETACLIVDLEMPGMSGLGLQARLAADGEHIPIIFITAYGNERMRARAMDAGALDFLEKPFKDETLLERIRAAVGT